MAVKSGRQTSMKCGRSRPADSLPTCVTTRLTVRPYQNTQNTPAVDDAMRRHDDDDAEVTAEQQVRRRLHAA